MNGYLCDTCAFTVCRPVYFLKMVLVLRLTFQIITIIKHSIFDISVKFACKKSELYQINQNCSKKVQIYYMWNYVSLL